MLNETVSQSVFEIKLAQFIKQYPVVPAPANPKVGIIYLYDLNDNYTLASKIAERLSTEIYSSGVLENIAALVMPGDSANMLGTLLFQKLLQHQTNLKLCIIRANPKGGSFQHIEYQSVTSTVKKTLHLREDQFHTISNKNVLIFDDIISSGATLNAISKLIATASANPVAYACFATEDCPLTNFQNKPLFKLSHLPIFNL